MLLFGFSNAQTTQNWKPLYLGSADGTNSFNGVQAYYTITTCGNDDYILVSFTNHNKYAVKAGWRTSVMTKDSRQVYRGDAQDSLIIQPGATVTGDCTGNSVQLVIKLTDLGILKEDFKDFIPAKFDFIIIH
jgi:hypothetical protein